MNLILIVIQYSLVVVIKHINIPLLNKLLTKHLIIMEELELLFVAYFATFIIVLEVTLPLVTEFIIRIINKFVDELSSTAKSITSWVIPILLMYAGWGIGHFFEGSFLVGLAWWHPLVFGGFAATFSNLAWMNIPWVKRLANWLLSWFIEYINKK